MTLVKKWQRIRVFFVALVCASSMGFSSLVNARSDFAQPNDGVALVKACREAVELYRSVEEQREFASLRTSVTEALYAGYCIGAIQNIPCKKPKKSWYFVAKQIAREPLDNIRENKFGQALILQQLACR